MIFLAVLFWFATLAVAADIPLRKMDNFWFFNVSELAKSQEMSVDWKPTEKHFSASNKDFQCSFVVGLPYISAQGKITPLSTKTQIDDEGNIWIPLKETFPVLEKAFKGNIAFDSTAKFLRISNTKITSTSLEKKEPLKGVTSEKKESQKNITSEKKEPQKTITPEKKEQAKEIKDDRSAKAGSREVKTIIIDPGHGGKDPGALGKNSQEKDIVLAVAKKLKKELETEGFEVKLTRDKDVFVELSERPNLANKWNGDLFISLHCNAIDGEERQKKTQGYHFYVLRAPESEEDKAIARRENKVASLYGDNKAKTEISPIEWIKIEASLVMYQQNSFRYTEELLKAFEKGKIKKLGSGAGGAGFMVLVGALMPAVLVELGFITHPDDEAYMISEKGQKVLSTKMADAVKNYRDIIHSYRETLAH